MFLSSRFNLWSSLYETVIEHLMISFGLSTDTIAYWRHHHPINISIPAHWKKFLYQVEHIPGQLSYLHGGLPTMLVVRKNINYSRDTKATKKYLPKFKISLGLQINDQFWGKINRNWSKKRWKFGRSKWQLDFPGKKVKEFLAHHNIQSRCENIVELQEINTYLNKY